MLRFWIWSPLNTVIEIGTSCRRSSVRRAVTMISSGLMPCAITGVAVSPAKATAGIATLLVSRLLKFLALMVSPLLRKHCSRYRQTVLRDGRLLPVRAGDFRLIEVGEARRPGIADLRLTPPKRLCSLPGADARQTFLPEGNTTNPSPVCKDNCEAFSSQLGT